MDNAIAALLSAVEVVSGGEAVKKYGMAALIGRHCAIVQLSTGVEGFRIHPGVIADPEASFIDMDDIGVLWVDYHNGDDWHLHSVSAGEQIVLLSTRERPDIDYVDGEALDPTAQDYLELQRQHDTLQSQLKALQDKCRAQS